MAIPLFSFTGHSALPAQEASFDGVFLADKPHGWTSHDLVAVLRKKIGFTKIGHTGTLDPGATGLLVMLIGKAAKKQSELQGCSKIYSGTIKFGIETDTWDAQGKVVSESAVPGITEQEVKSLAERFNGRIKQQVPPFSAVKYQGKRLYKLARKGVAVPVIERVVDVKWIQYLWNSPELKFEIECSGGTYIRSIAHEMGKAVGCGAHLKDLRRLKVKNWLVEQAFPGDSIKTADIREIISRIIPYDRQ